MKIISSVDRVEDAHTVSPAPNQTVHVDEVAVAQLSAEPATSVAHLMVELWP